MNKVEKMYRYKEDGVADNYTESIDGKNILKVKFQVGGTADNPINGVWVEDLLIVANAKLNEYNQLFPSRENSLAMTNIEQAILWLSARKTERELRGVYGKRES